MAVYSGVSLHYASDLYAVLTTEEVDVLNKDLSFDAFPGFGIDAASNDIGGACWFAREIATTRIIAALWISPSFIPGIDEIGNLLFNVFTHSSFRRRGIMNQLLKKALDERKQMRDEDEDDDVLYLAAWENNVGAIDLYNKHGFTLHMNILYPNVATGKPERAVIMKLQ